MRTVPRGDDLHGWVALLAVDRRRRLARQHLLAAGDAAVPALRAGLHHDHVMVRRACAGILDVLVDEASVMELVAALDDPDTEVRRRALHALACDPCKAGECRPADDLFVPRGLALLDDPDPDVRAGAVDALGKVTRRGRPDVAAALAHVAEHDRDPRIRAMARQRVTRR